MADNKSKFDKIETETVEEVKSQVKNQKCPCTPVERNPDCPTHG